MGRVAPEEVDRSRQGFLIHAANNNGRGLRLTTYIEGLQGDDSRNAIEAHIVCRTAEQSAELARVLREARFDPSSPVVSRCDICHGMTILPCWMDAPGHPRCACGRPSVHESGECEVDHGPVPCPRCGPPKQP